MPSSDSSSMRSSLVRVCISHLSQYSHISDSHSQLTGRQSKFNDNKTLCRKISRIKIKYHFFQNSCWPYGPLYRDCWWHITSFTPAPLMHMSVHFMILSCYLLSKADRLLDILTIPRVYRSCKALWVRRPRSTVDYAQTCLASSLGSSLSLGIIFNRKRCFIANSLSLSLFHRLI